MRLLLLSLVTISLSMAACQNPDGRTRKVTWDKNVSAERLEQGLVVILPGIEGESSANRNIRKGYRDAGVPYALAIYRWGFELPGINLLVNQVDVKRNRKAAAELAQRIVKYQQLYPGRPVFIVGHSAGGGMTIFTLEAMRNTPGASPISGAILLSASISANYNISTALSMCRLGILNVANPEDNLLDGGTKTFGNVDGGHGESAGRVKFTHHFARLWQALITAKQMGVIDTPHFVATNPRIIRDYCAKWIMASQWPPAGCKITH